MKIDRLHLDDNSLNLSESMKDIDFFDNQKRECNICMGAESKKLGNCLFAATCELKINISSAGDGNFTYSMEFISDMGGWISSVKYAFSVLTLKYCVKTDVDILNSIIETNFKLPDPDEWMWARMA